MSRATADAAASRPVFRFAPSPNGWLHLGHAFSALANSDMAEAAGGRFLLRIEDIDLTRCRREFEDGIFEDLAWLGISWEEPVRRQSEHFATYREALDRLAREELVYPAFMSRAEIRGFIADREDEGERWPRDPDGAPLYPGADRRLSMRQRRVLIDGGAPFSWRLDIEAAVKRVSRRLGWLEEGHGPAGETGWVDARPLDWGDVLVARRDIPTSYHIAVVVDDALQDVSDVVRGRDLFHAASVQRLLQELLDFPAPRYFHHDLVLGDDGRKLSKSRNDTALRELRRAGLTAADIRRIVAPAPRL